MDTFYSFAGGGETLIGYTHYSVEVNGLYA